MARCMKRNGHMAIWVSEEALNYTKSLCYSGFLHYLIVIAGPMQKAHLTLNKYPHIILMASKACDYISIYISPHYMALAHSSLWSMHLLVAADHPKTVHASSMYHAECTPESWVVSRSMFCLPCADVVTWRLKETRRGWTNGTVYTCFSEPVSFCRPETVMFSSSDLPRSELNYIYDWILSPFSITLSITTSLS